MSYENDKYDDDKEDKVCLLILDTNEDAMLLSRPFCETCVNKKIKTHFKANVIKFCKISNKESKELIDFYEGLTNLYMEELDIKDNSKKQKKISKSSKLPLRTIRVKCECK